MALFSRVKTWVSNEVLTAADLNAEFDNILNNSVASSIIGASANVTAMQATVDPGDVGSESLAASVAGELQRLRYVIKRIIGEAQWYSTPTRTLAAGQLAVGEADIQDGVITRVKLGPFGEQISEVTTGLASGEFSTDSSTPVDVTNLQVTLQTTGRPVWLGLISAIAGGDESPYPTFPPPGVEIFSRFNESFAEGHIHFVRNGTKIDELAVGLSALVSASTTIQTSQSHTHNATTNVNLGSMTKQDPLSSFWTIDRPPAGTHTYKVQASVFVGTITIRLARLMAFEL